jgi:hypothetical protein
MNYIDESHKKAARTGRLFLVLKFRKNSTTTAALILMQPVGVSQRVDVR